MDYIGKTVRYKRLGDSTKYIGTVIAYNSIVNNVTIKGGPNSEFRIVKNIKDIEIINNR